MKQFLPLLLGALWRFALSHFFVFNAGHTPLNWFHNPPVGQGVQSEKYWPRNSHHTLVSSRHLFIRSVTPESLLKFDFSPELQTLVPNCLLSVPTRRSQSECTPSTAQCLLPSPLPKFPSLCSPSPERITLDPSDEARNLVGVPLLPLLIVHT